MSYSTLKQNIQDFLEDQTAGSEEEAAEFFAEQCMQQVLLKVKPLGGQLNVVLPANKAPIKAAFLTAMNSIKSTGVNTLANWTPVSTAWGVAVTFPAWPDVAPPAFLHATVGAAAVPAGAAKLADAFSKNEKTSAQVATKFKDAIKIVMDGVTYVKTNTVSGVTAPGTGLFP